MCKSIQSFAADDEATHRFDLSVNPPSLGDADVGWCSPSGFGTIGHCVFGLSNYRYIVCIDSLGEAKSLVYCGNGMLELTTTEGIYSITRCVLPAFYVFGFVGTMSAGIPGKGAYYFDVRIAAALWRHIRKLSAEGDSSVGMNLSLASEEESWAYLSKMNHPGSWACEQVFSQVTWTDKAGVPIFNPDTDKEAYDLQKMENLPRCLAKFPKRLSRLAKLDYQLRKYIMLCRVDSEFKKLYATDPYEYWRNTNSFFVAKRMAHYEELSKYSRNYRRLFACSDIHETNIEDLNPSSADIVLLAGDIQGHARCSGPKPSARRIVSQIQWVNEHFLPWCAKYPRTQFVVVAGNNDEFALDPANPLLNQPEGSNIHYLQDSGIEIKGLKIWGTPWVKPKLHRIGALKPFERKDEDFRKALAKMPAGVDILVSHATPAVEDSSIADLPEKHYGSEVLTEAIKEKKPKVCVCGHIHASHHYPVMLGETVIMNVSLIHNDRFHAEYRPRTFSMVKDEAGAFHLAQSYEEMHDNLKI